MNAERRGARPSLGSLHRQAGVPSQVLSSSIKIQWTTRLAVLGDE